jgi:hypothetical protein
MEHFKKPFLVDSNRSFVILVKLERIKLFVFISKQLLSCMLVHPEANMLWVCQYYFHHPQENCSVWNGLIASQEIITGNLFPVM